LEIGVVDGHMPSREAFATRPRARWDMRSRRRHGARLNSSGRLFNEWLGKSRSDLALLTTRMETGPYPYAGIPWFSTAFGRDAIITAWQILWFEPSLAKGVLRYLAAHQALERSSPRQRARQDHARDPQGRDAGASGEVPFGRYYGGATPRRCSWPWPAPIRPAPATTR
jgi:glycogen debranching enzyme